MCDLWETCQRFDGFVIVSANYQHIKSQVLSL